jgi:hypothetical protein
MFDIKQRDVPEQLVLTEQRSVRAGSWSASSTAPVSA